MTKDPHFLIKSTMRVIQIQKVSFRCRNIFDSIRILVWFIFLTWKVLVSLDLEVTFLFGKGSFVNKMTVRLMYLVLKTQDCRTDTNRSFSRLLRFRTGQRIPIVSKQVYLTPQKDYRNNNIKDGQRVFTPSYYNYLTEGGVIREKSQSNGQWGLFVDP